MYIYIIFDIIKIDCQNLSFFRLGINSTRSEGIKKKTFAIIKNFLKKFDIYFSTTDCIGLDLYFKFCIQSVIRCLLHLLV